MKLYQKVDSKYFRSKLSTASQVVVQLRDMFYEPSRLNLSRVSSLWEKADYDLGVL